MLVTDAGRDAGLVDAGALDAGTDAGRPDAGTADAGGMPKPCIDGRFTLSTAEPVVMLVLDRSGSMMNTFAGGMVSMWTALRDALRVTLPAVNQTMQIGGLFFPVDGARECEVPAVAGVRPAKGNVPLLLTTLDSVEPIGATPTLQAVRVASEVLLSRRTSNTARAMVLATDGAPSCSTLGETLAEIERAADGGVPTYVVGLQTSGVPGLVTALNQMAVAGRRPRDGARRFFSAESGAELQRAFTTIRDQVGACSFLTDSVPSLDGGAMTVTLGGVLVPFDESGVTGWRWTDRPNGELVLQGADCQRAIAQPSLLNVVVSCGP